MATEPAVTNKTTVKGQSKDQRDRVSVGDTRPGAKLENEVERRTAEAIDRARKSVAVPPKAQQKAVPPSLDLRDLKKPVSQSSDSKAQKTPVQPSKPSTPHSK